ncbi:trafficking regulator of GLUT4 1-like [Oculina patagonica]
MDSSRTAVELQPYTTRQVGYPPQYGYMSPQQPRYPPQQHQPERTTVLNIPMPVTQTVVVPANPRPRSWLGLSTTTCMFCFWPIGLAAIVFSCMVDSAYDAGDYDGALRNSNIAKWLNVVSIIGGIVLIIVIYVTLGVSY